jgi:hypothetical protein
MIDLFTQRPSDHPCIQSVWKARITGKGQHTLPARGSWDFIFMKRHDSSSALLVAPSKIAIVSDYAEDEAEYFGIKLAPGFFPAHLNASTMLHEVQNLETLKSVITINGASIEVPTFDTAEQFVDALLSQGVFDNDPVVQAALSGSEKSGVTLRSIQRRFSRSTGIPKTHFERIDQAAQAEALLLNGASAADVTYQMGYYDQSHLIRSLKLLRGFTPSQIRDMSRR